MSAIHIVNVNKRFKRYVKQEKVIDNFLHRKYEEKVAVDNISIDIEQGECVAVIGQNGAGKTTLMKMMSGLLLPTSGEIKVLDYIPFKKEKEFKKKITLLLGQKQQLWWDVSAKDNYILLKDIYELSNSEYKNNLDELIELLNLSEIINIPVRTLSLGERMKCELAGSLLYKPQILFLDEPTIGLDLIAQNQVRKFVKNYSQINKATVILTSHNMDDIEEVCNRTIFVDKGKMYFDGMLSEFVKLHGEDGILTTEFSKAAIQCDWSKYGSVIELGESSVRIRISKKNKQEIRTEIENISGVNNTIFTELDAEEIVRDFYEKEK